MPDIRRDGAPDWAAVQPAINRSPLDAIVADWAAEHHCPSIVWGVIAGGSLALSGSVGDVRGVTPDERTVFRIASMTKSFSAALVLMLRDEGVLRLDEPIDAYAPELAAIRAPTADSGPITVRDLLCMTPGLVNDDAWADRHLALPDAELDRAIRAGLTFAHAPGNVFEYSNLGYALLGRVVHRATGSRLQQLVSERLLTPLALDDTTWAQPDHDRWAPPLRRTGDGWAPELPTPGDGAIAPMGGLWTTVRDLATWVAWLAGATPARDDPDQGPLSRSSRREMQTAQRYAGSRTLRGRPTPTSYAYGLQVLDERDQGLVVGHSGGLPGYGSAMRWDPRTGVGFVAMSNVTYAPMTPLIALLHDEVRAQAVADRDRPAGSDHLDACGRLLVGVLNRWATGDHVPEDELDDVFAANVAPDDAYALRADLAARHGRLTFERLRPVNAARCEIVCTTPSQATATVTFALAPIGPPRIQSYSVDVSGDERSGEGASN